jgi:hypothetical protein
MFIFNVLTLKLATHELVLSMGYGNGECLLLAGNVACSWGSGVIEVLFINGAEIGTEVLYF